MQEIRIAISRTNKTTWANTDNLLGRNAFFKGDIGQKIATDGSGGDVDRIDSLEYPEMASGGATTKAM